MNLRQFIDLVSSTYGAYTYYACERRSGLGFNGRTDNVYIDTVIGFSFMKREEMGDDWGIGNTPVLAIKTVEAYGRAIPCAVIE